MASIACVVSPGMGPLGATDNGLLRVWLELLFGVGDIFCGVFNPYNLKSGHRTL